MIGRIETVSLGYSLVFSGLPSGAVPAGGRPIFGAVSDLMPPEYFMLGKKETSKILVDLFT